MFKVWGLILAAAVMSHGGEIKGKFYKDRQGGETYFPLGDISFTDEVVSFERREPNNKKNSDPAQALSMPDNRTLSLSCGGNVVLAFNDNSLVDIKGADLYVFEAGPDVEPTSLSISKDGKEWIEIGRVAGGKAEIDIAPYVSKSDVFRFVRLTDLKSACNSSYPGADIDAVGAIGSGIKLSLTAAILFDSGRFRLKEGADAEIARQLHTVDGFDSMKVVVEGHTDNVGTVEANIELSKKRALAVREYLVSKENIDPNLITIRGYGESQPIADNERQEGREKNRRVEMIFSYRELE